MKLLLHLLRTVTWPSWAEHRSRTALTILGIALGAATVSAVADIQRSVLASYRATLGAMTGDFELEVSSTAGPIDESLVQRARATPGPLRISGRWA